MITKRIACYARVSTQDQSTGMESQIRVLKTYCEQNGYTNAEFFTDEGISGTKSSRPALDRMMEAVNKDEISSVVVYSFSRFARSTTHLLNALQIFKKKGVHFTSISEKIDTNTAIGVAIFSILASIAQLERDLISDRVKIGLQNARAKGKLIGRKKMRDSDLTSPVVCGHFVVSFIDEWFIAIAASNSRAKIVRHGDRSDAAEEGPHSAMRTNPIRQCLRHSGFCKSIRTCAKASYKKLCAPSLTSFCVNQPKTIAVIDKGFFTGFVILPHHHREFARPSFVMLTELRIAVAITSMSLSIFGP